jgi:VanZ like family
MHECELPHVSRSFERDRLRAIFDELSRRDPVGYDIRMFHKLMVVAAWALLALIACATISPIQDRPTLLTSSSFEHLAAFAVLGALFYLVYPRHIAFVCLIVLGSAVVLELVQLLTPDRHGRVPDAVEKIAGGAAGIVAGLVGWIALSLLGY